MRGITGSPTAGAVPRPGAAPKIRCPSGSGGHGCAAVGHGIGTSAESIMPTDLPSVACRGGCRARGGRAVQHPGQDDRQGWGRRHRDRRQWDPGGRYAWGDLESAGGRRGRARVDLVRERVGRPGCPARADLPRHPDGRGVRRPGRRGGRGPAARRLHAAARRQRPGRPVRAAARFGGRAHHDRHPGPHRGAHRAADLLVRAHQRGEERPARRQRQRLHRRGLRHQAVADQRGRRGRSAPRGHARQRPRCARRAPDGRGAAGRERCRDADLRAAPTGADPRPLGRRHAGRPRPARAAGGGGRRRGPPAAG